MNDPLAWLDRLASARPLGAGHLTADMLEQAAPPPVPLAGAPGTQAAWFLAVRVTPLLAEDSSRRADLRARRLRTRGECLAAVLDAEAESTFWLEVRNFACTWSEECEPARGWPGCCARPELRSAG